jgi:phosphoglycolate phosphatase-like HAD superfamily hydrolase
MTDRGIARLGLEAAQREHADELVDQLLDAYVNALKDELARGTPYQVMPNVRELVAELGRELHVGIGLGTGNLKRGAEAKLRYGGLWELFAFGGFGCDHEDRTELLRVGAERGARALGVPREQCRVVVVGDTVRDVAAAHGIGAACIGVETGGVSAETLRAAGADVVFHDLGASGVLDALLNLNRVS